ncbi:hypothetical protein SAMN05443292_1354 [Halpernia frigidisoli]|uniref:Uncharacterized protein n=1 Tax=Halpernia frigidisoli TaxID=1125876 RepID=A0A1I3FG04_9FLAO|nr:hypothetical protein SAMN05443292_1354 [Halpernia frigidisoli]
MLLIVLMILLLIILIFYKMEVIEVGTGSWGKNRTINW